MLQILSDWRSCQVGLLFSHKTYRKMWKFSNTTPDVSKHWLISWSILGYSVILVYYSVSYSLICIQFIICWQIVCKWAELYANEASCCPSCFCSIFLPSVFSFMNSGSFLYSKLRDLHWEKFKTSSLLICIQCVNHQKY